MAGTCSYRIWGKMGAQGKSENSKPVMVTAKRETECVCVGFSGREGWEWRKRLSLETSEKLGSVNYVTRILCDM